MKRSCTSSAFCRGGFSSSILPRMSNAILPRPSNPRYTWWRWQIFTVTWLAYAGFYLTRKSFSVAKIGISHDPKLKMSDAQMAWIDGAYLTSYAIGQFLFGMAGDRLGTRVVVATGMFI